MSLLEIDGVSVWFGGQQALAGVELRVHHREVVGLIGPNGAGKTTLFNCISGFQQLGEGQVLFQGVDIVPLPPQERARTGIARTFQRVEVFPRLNVVDNVVIGVEGVRETSLVKGLVRTPGIRRREVDAYEKARAVLNVVGMEGYASTPVASLPLGLLRRVELARALASSPQLLLLDEPVSGMDEGESAEFAALIAQIQALFGVAVLIIDHDIGVVRAISQYLYVLDFGRIIAHGDPDDVSSDPHVIAAYLGEEVTSRNEAVAGAGR